MVFIGKFLSSDVSFFRGDLELANCFSHSLFGGTLSGFSPRNQSFIRSIGSSPRLAFSWSEGGALPSSTCCYNSRDFMRVLSELVVMSLEFWPWELVRATILEYLRTDIWLSTEICNVYLIFASNSSKFSEFSFWNMVLWRLWNFWVSALPLNWSANLRPSIAWISHAVHGRPISAI